MPNPTTRLTAIETDEVSAVDHAANLTTFVIRKQRAGESSAAMFTAAVAKGRAFRASLAPSSSVVAKFGGGLTLELARRSSPRWPSDLSAVASPTAKRGAPDFVRVAKAAPGAAKEQRYVLGPVLVPETVDAQGDIYSADVIEATAWRWESEFRNVGLMHKGLVNDKIRPVESYIVRSDTTIGGAAIKAGTWMLGAVVKDDELWQAVKDGKIAGWSIGGRAVKSSLA